MMRKLNNHHIAWLAVLIAVGLIIFMFEMYIPRPLPWLKPGLANIVTLLAIYLFSLEDALIVVGARVVLGSLIVGTFLNPAFILAAGGGVAATLVMAGTKKMGAHIFSIFGVSILGAVTHNMTQLILVDLLIVRQQEILYLIPVLLLSSLFSGIIVATISYYLLKNISM